MAEESDSSSVQSTATVSDQNTDKKSNEQQRFYALYTFYPNRPRSVADTTLGEGIDQTEDGNLSLSVAATNLSASAETDLRKSLAQRLSKSPPQAGLGNFLSVGISSSEDVITSAACYYCVLKNCSATAEQTEPVTEDTNVHTRKFVVCFTSFFDSSLDLFRHDLDTYCEGLIQLLDDEYLLTLLRIRKVKQQGREAGQHPHNAGPSPFHRTAPPAAMSTGREGESRSTRREPSVICSVSIAFEIKLSQLTTSVKTYLEGWHETVLDYLTRCITIMSPENLQNLIYTALVDASLQIFGACPRDEDDIKRFVGCCTLSPLLEQLQTTDQEKAGIGSLGESWQIQSPVITLTFTEKGPVFDKQNLELCNFCKLAADHLKAIDSRNVTKVRDSLDAIKLAFIHNLNKLKRCLKEAELDHYALYRAYVFLKKSGCASLLLRYVKLDASSEILKVLDALEKFIHDKNITFS